MDYQQFVGKQVDGHVEKQVFKARNGSTFPYETHHVTLPDDLVKMLQENKTPYRIIEKGGIYTQDVRMGRVNFKVDHLPEGFFITEVYFG